MTPEQESNKIAGDLAFHILYHGYHQIDRNEAEDRIACDILSYHLPALVQEEVDLAFTVALEIADLNQGK